MSLPREQAFATQLIGKRVLRLDVVESTNSEAASLANDPRNDGLVITAEEQTAGRGRRGRRWICPRGQGLLLSVLLFPPEPMRRPSIMTALAAVSVCEAIYDCTQFQTTVKWPNDVLIRGRKVCGILVEQGQATVIGIGINVSTPAETLKAEGLDDAAALDMFAPSPVNREEMLRALIHQLDANYADLRAGHDADLTASWRWHSGLLGRQVEVSTGDGVFRGRLEDLTLTQVMLQEPNGNVRRFEPEAVETISALRDEPP